MSLRHLFHPLAVIAGLSFILSLGLSWLYPLARIPDIYQLSQLSGVVLQPPTDLRFTCLQSQAKIEWTAPAGATEYLLILNNLANDWDAQNPLPGDKMETLTQTSYVFTTEPEATYYWSLIPKVSGVLAENDDARVFEDTIDCNPPLSEPANLAVSCQAQGQIQLNWDRVPGATGYQLGINNQANDWNGSSMLPGDVSEVITQNQYTFVVEPGLVYSWWVTPARPGVGYTGKAGPQINCDPPLVPPKNLKVQCNSNQSVTISWDPTLGATSYQLGINDQTNDWDSTDLLSGDIYQSLSDSSFTFLWRSGHMYTWWVTPVRYVIPYEGVAGPAIDCNGAIGSLANLQATCQDVSTVPNGKEILVSWQAASGADRYVLAIDDAQDPWDGGESNPGDRVIEITDTTYRFVPDYLHNYNWWVIPYRQLTPGQGVAGQSLKCHRPQAGDPNYCPSSVEPQDLEDPNYQIPTQARQCSAVGNPQLCYQGQWTDINSGCPTGLLCKQGFCQAIQGVSGVCRYDYIQDGIINIKDLLEVLARWGSADPFASGQSVAVEQLLGTLSYFGSTCQS